MGYYFTRINHQNQETDIGTIHREWDGWMASLTQRTWVWANSGRQWRTRKPGVLQSLGLQRVRHNWGTEWQPQLQPTGQKGFRITDIRSGGSWIHPTETSRLKEKLSCRNESLWSPGLTIWKHFSPGVPGSEHLVSNLGQLFNRLHFRPETWVNIQS